MLSGFMGPVAAQRKGSTLTAIVEVGGGWFENDSKKEPFSGDHGDWLEHTGLIGIRYSFGGLGIKANDRKGAGLDLPNYLRWAAAGDTLD